MNKILKYLLFGIAFIIVGLLVGFKLNDQSSSRGMISIDDGVRKLQETIYFIQRNYVKSLDNDKLVDDAIQGMLDGLDPHSFYIPRSEMKQMEEQMTGGFDGIGIEFSILEDTIYVVTPIAGGPSEKQGIMAGDRIVKVDGKNLAGVNITNLDVMKNLKGPKGTNVVVSVARRGVKELIDFDITRDRIPLYSVSYSYMMDDETGYMRVTRFSETTYDEFRQHLGELIDEGMQSLILDLRGNPGGYMTMAYKMADEFLQKDKLIVSTEGRISESKQRYVATSSIGSFEKGGLVVLIDYGSASASEIVSGAIQDHDRGLIVGVRSFGKGLVQIQKKFDDGSAIRVVISEYYTPSGRCIQKPYDKSSQDYNHEIVERFESGEIYDESKIPVPDSLVFKTAAGRTVYGGGGIYPDVFVSTDTSGLSKFLTDLNSKDMFRGFAYVYADDHEAITRNFSSSRDFTNRFEVDKELLQEFKSYVEAHGLTFDPVGYQASKKYIHNNLKALIGRKLYQDDGYYPVLHQTDNVLEEAKKLMPAARELSETGKFTYED
ncbi:MAG: S41 family peptidase [Bacteroidota bacterium]